MTPKERAAMQQALEALVKCNHFHDYEDEITALREALAEQAEQEPAAKHWHDLYREKCQELHDERARLGAEIVALEAEQAEQEPVAWGRVFDGDIIDCICPEEHALNEGDYTIPLYAAPVRTKDLTDDEIEVIFKLNIGKQYDDFARAVIAADREKNNG